MFLHKAPRYVEPPPPHHCAAPGGATPRPTAIDCGLGSIWQCDECKRHWELCDNEPDEWGYGGGWWWGPITPRRAHRLLRRHAPRADGLPVVATGEQVDDALAEVRGARHAPR